MLKRIFSSKKDGLKVSSEASVEAGNVNRKDKLTETTPIAPKPGQARQAQDGQVKAQPEPEPVSTQPTAPGTIVNYKSIVFNLTVVLFVLLVIALLAFLVYNYVKIIKDSK